MGKLEFNIQKVKKGDNKKQLEKLKYTPIRMILYFYPKHNKDYQSLRTQEAQRSASACSNSKTLLDSNLNISKTTDNKMQPEESYLRKHNNKNNNEIQRKQLMQQFAAQKENIPLLQTAIAKICFNSTMSGQNNSTTVAQSSNKQMLHSTQSQSYFQQTPIVLNNRNFRVLKERQPSSNQQQNQQQSHLNNDISQYLPLKMNTLTNNSAKYSVYEQSLDMKNITSTSSRNIRSNILSYLPNNLANHNSITNQSFQNSLSIDKNISNNNNNSSNLTQIRKIRNSFYSNNTLGSDGYIREQSSNQSAVTSLPNIHTISPINTLKKNLRTNVSTKTIITLTPHNNSKDTNNSSTILAGGQQSKEIIQQKRPYIVKSLDVSPQPSKSCPVLESNEGERQITQINLEHGRTAKLQKKLLFSHDQEDHSIHHKSSNDENNKRFQRFSNLRAYYQDKYEIAGEKKWKEESTGIKKKEQQQNLEQHYKNNDIDQIKPWDNESNDSFSQLDSQFL